MARAPKRLYVVVSRLGAEPFLSRSEAETDCRYENENGRPSRIVAYAPVPAARTSKTKGKGR